MTARSRAPGAGVRCGRPRPCTDRRHRAGVGDARRGEPRIAKFTGGKALEKGKITIDLPEIAENGNTVPLHDHRR